MPTTAITGKQFTVTFNSVAGTAQITSGTIEESASSTTIQTLGGSVAVSEGVESSVSCDFLYDGPESGSFYLALKTALNAGTAATITIIGGDSSWTGSAIVTSLSAEFPADGATTCSAELTISGALTFDEDI
jgi:predicted secreted protein